MPITVTFIASVPAGVQNPHMIPSLSRNLHSVLGLLGLFALLIGVLLPREAASKAVFSGVVPADTSFGVPDRASSDGIAASDATSTAVIGGGPAVPVIAAASVVVGSIWPSVAAAAARRSDCCWPASRASPRLF
ncbi:MAG TPA: hypothetical protein VGC31_00805 [Paenirhodobacter sp.]